MWADGLWLSDYDPVSVSIVSTDNGTWSDGLMTTDKKPKVDLFVGERVADVDKELYKTIASTCMRLAKSQGSRCLVVGSPWPNKNFFSKGLKKSKESNDG